MNKRFGIDARWITREISGIGRYTERLIHAMTQEDTENLYFIFFSDKEIQAQFSKKFPYHLRSNVNPITVPYSPFSLKGMWAIRKEIKRFKIDLFHSTNFMIPLLGPKIKYVATVHDLIPLIHPEYTPKAKKTRFYWLYKTLMQHIVKKCALILTDSEHSKKDLVQTLSVPEERVQRIYISIDGKYKPKTTSVFPEAIEKEMNVRPPYFLYVGRHDPYKNILGLVQAYADTLKEEPNPIPLVVTGKLDARYPEAYQFCEQNKLLEKVVFTGYVSDSNLLALYQYAHALILVSKYEGFGLPVLEAMASGTPVICSKSASLPEVAGEAAVLVEAESKQEIARALCLLIQNNDLREQLIEKGLSQVKKFSWKECGQATRQAYLSVL